jgi:TATA-box binding protein (TBP) (component of TFIID and TFIIIB)
VASTWLSRCNATYGTQTFEGRIYFGAAVAARADMVLHNVPTLKICNIASDVDLGVTIDLDLLTMVGGFKQDRLRLHATIIWLDNPKASALVFEKGRMVVVGATSEHSAFLAAIRFFRLIKPHFPAAVFKRFRINNVLANGSFDGMVDLERFDREKTLGATYEPEKFPGLVFNSPHPSGVGRLTALVFMSGQVVVAGACSMRDVQDRLELIWSRVSPYVLTGEEAERLKSHPAIVSERRELRKVLEQKQASMMPETLLGENDGNI